MSDPYLLLWLEAPLQAWGHDSRFGRRDTLDFPTRSGVLGLICCALGAGGEQRELLARLTAGEMTVEAYAPTDRDGNPLPRPPLLRDFHMVGSGYDTEDPWESLMVPKTAEGKKAVGAGTKMTYRYALQDMAYAVSLQVPDDLAEEIGHALVAPTWDLYLGRKHCVPTEFIFQGQFPSAKEAVERARDLARTKHRTFNFRVLEGEHEGEALTLNDVPLQFGTDKRYRDRRVTVQDWQV